MAQPSFVLRLTRAGQPPTEFEFAQERVTVGREVGDVAVHDPGCSSRHAEILFATGQVVLVDIGSTNGTWLGSRRIQREHMAPGVRFTIGKTTLELVRVLGMEDQPGFTVVMGPPGTATGSVTVPPGSAKGARTATPVARRRLLLA
ncbi:MAG: FHA domain-containing protein, partial [Planctomycetota bacterium]